MEVTIKASTNSLNSGIERKTLVLARTAPILITGLSMIEIPKNLFLDYPEFRLVVRF
jgi:hypothetical protein